MDATGDARDVRRLLPRRRRAPVAASAKRGRRSTPAESCGA
jgi:hypothetical protein